MKFGKISSPYSFGQTLQWVYYYFFPSTTNRSDIALMPIQSGEIHPANLNISFVGDLMCLSDEKVVEPHPQMISLFECADLIIINLEAPVVRDKIQKNKSLLVFGLSNEFIERFLKLYQIQKEKLIFTIANNHIGDFNKEGYDETRKRLQDLGIKFVGDQSDTENVLTIQVKNHRVGFFAFSQWLNRLEFEKADAICRAKHIEKVDFHKIKKDKQLDLMIILPHWGFEFRHFPCKDTVQMAKTLIEKGADIIAASHPHVLGPIEKIHHGLCHYSLGNFFSKTLHYATHLTGIWSVSYDRSNREGDPFAYQLHPFYMTSQNKFELIDRLPVKLMGKLLKRLSLIYPESDR